MKRGAVRLARSWSSLTLWRLRCGALAELEASRERVYTTLRRTP
jgi:hypothetical protein